MENYPPQNQHETETEAQRIEREMDALFNIIPTDIEDATRIYPVIRNEQRDAAGNVISPRRIEGGWMLVGNGVSPKDENVAVGKFQRYEDDTTLTKYLPMKEQNELLAKQIAEHEERRKIFKPRFGEAVMAVARKPEAPVAEHFIEPENEREKSAEEARALIDAARQASQPALEQIMNSEQDK